MVKIVKIIEFFLGIFVVIIWICYWVYVGDREIYKEYKVLS